MRSSLLCFFLGACVTGSALADWPQWRGPNRDGVAVNTAPLPHLTEENPPVELWEVPGIPSDYDGGHGSPVVSKGRVILALVWHRDEPTEKRQFTQRVLSDLGHRSTRRLDPAVVEKMEHDRMNLSRRLRGKALEDYARQWVDDHLDEKEKLSLGSWVVSRFIKGPNAISIAVLEEINAKTRHVFANQEELEAWVAERDWSDSVKAEVLSKVPATEKKATDVILSLDAATGEEDWRFEVPGSPSGRSSSSTPVVSDGRIYAALSDHIYCVDETDGRELWRSPLEGRKGPASSPLLAHGRIYLQQDRLTAFDADTGEVVWENTQIKSSNPSPNAWGGVVICNSSNQIVGVNAETGEIQWTLPGGGDATPAISGDFLAVISRNEENNMSVYRLGEGEPEKLWTKNFTARRYSSSPIIHGGFLYYLGSSRHLCIELETGEVRWERPMQSEISSPILADGKILVYENRGGLLSMISASPEEYTVLGKTKIAALYCASPAIVGRDLFFRTKDSVRCFRLGSP